jgi:hypothetical protein
MKAKYVIAGIAAVGIGVYWWKTDYVRRITKVFSNMRVYVSNIKNLQFTGTNTVAVTLSFILENPTNEGFTVTGANVAKLKSLMVYYDGNYLGTANLGLTELQIPAQTTIQITDVPFTISAQGIYQTIAAGQFTTEHLTIKAIVNVLGKDYTIESQLSV